MTIKNGGFTMNAARKVLNTLKENYMEYVDLMYGPFNR
jgi:hypothetical protein